MTYRGGEFSLPQQKNFFKDKFVKTLLSSKKRLYNFFQINILAYLRLAYRQVLKYYSLKHNWILNELCKNRF